MSPYTVMARRKGNAFELSTVLVSYLLGAEYDAYVVVGRATRDFTRNIQLRKECPGVPQPPPPEPEPEKPEPKYRLAQTPDLRSKHLVAMDIKAAKKKQDEEDAILEEKLKEIREQELPPADRLEGSRMHAWALVLPPCRGVAGPFFIEPSTGNRHEVHCPDYTGLESVYNHENYWVNIQEYPDGVGKLEFDLHNTRHWEHLLAGEPPRHRNMPGVDAADPRTAVDTEKHLDMPASWVERLDVSVDDFQRRYPGGSKLVRYKKALLEKFAPYLQHDGVVKRIRLFEDYCYKIPTIMYEWFEHRVDRLLTIKTDYLKKEITEDFKRGREDYLKKHTYSMDAPAGSIEANRCMEYFYYARVDHMERADMTPASFTEHYIDRDDRLYFREILYTAKTKDKDEEWKRQITSITEKFHRNPDIPAREDVAKRLFDLRHNRIELVYHYAFNFVTMNTRNFEKPNLAESAGVVLYDPTKNSGYVADINEDFPRALDLYRTLCHKLETEDVSRRLVRDHEGDALTCLRLRRRQLAEPRLCVALFDTERNKAAQIGFAEQELKKREQVDREIEAELDPLTPYLARLRGGVWAAAGALGGKQAALLREQCLTDFKASQLARQTLVQERYDKLNEEYKNKRLWYLANQYILKPDQEAAYFEDSAELSFQVHVMEVRMSRHRELSKLRYQQLVDLLNRHPLLTEFNRVLVRSLSD